MYSLVLPTQYTYIPIPLRGLVIGTPRYVTRYNIVTRYVTRYNIVTRYNVVTRYVIGVCL